MTDTRTATQEPVTARSVWALDPTHSSLHFSGRQMMISTVRGRFARFDARIEGSDADPENATVQVTVDASSVESGLGQRDEHLRSPDLLDVAAFPTIEFQSRSIKKADDDRLTVEGDLTIKGVTRRVVLDVEYLGYARDPWGNDRAAFSATATINREDWGLTNNMALDSGRLLVSKRIQLEIELELIHQGEPGE